MVLSNVGKMIDDVSEGQLSQLLKKGDLAEKTGSTLLLHYIPGLQATRILCVHCGEPGKFQAKQFRDVITQVATVLQSGVSQKIGCDLAGFSLASLDDKACDNNTCDNNAWKIRTTIELFETTCYRFSSFQSEPYDPIPSLQSLNFYIANPDKAREETAIKQGLAIAQGMHLTRNLANRPANHCTPRYMAEQARRLADQNPSLNVEILNKEDPEVAKMGAFLAVASGSLEPAQFVIIRYQPQINTSQKPIVLVGKGVTFDSGGISIKPSAKMEEMKFDMTGAASVLGTLQAVAQLNLPLPLIGILPLTENLPSGTAVKPGDVVTTLSGKTIEILNTDAEGRLILADALTYSERFDPEIVIDIATLTGAVIVSLGPVATGLMSPDAELVQALETAGNASGDYVWELPLWEDYQAFIKSNVADIANIGDGSGAGSITAASFLSHFTEKFRWAHLDIAGTAWKSGKNKTATGRPVPLLMRYLLNYCSL